MLSLWHYVPVSLVFDLRRVKRSPDGDSYTYVYKKFNTVPSYMFCTPIFDILFIPTQAIHKKSCIKSGNATFDSTQNMSSYNDLFATILRQSTKKHPTSYDYTNMFPLLIRCQLIQKITSACLIEHQEFQTTSNEQKLSAVQSKTNSIAIFFKEKDSSKQLRQIGLLFNENVTNSTLFKQSEYMNHNILSRSLESNNISPTICSSGGLSPSKLKPSSSPSNYTLDTNEIVEKIHAIMKNIHKRAVTFLEAGLGVLQSRLKCYANIRPLHISFNNVIHTSLLCDIGKVLLVKNQNLHYLENLDFQSTPGLIVKHQGLFEIIRRQIIDSCEKTTTVDSFFWHMLGFQGSAPLTDFRASSLLSLISLRIFADQHPDILFSELYGEYEDELDWINHMLFVCAKRTTDQIREAISSLPDEKNATAALESLLNHEIGTLKTYSYPIALSVLDITHYIFTKDDIAQSTIKMTPFLTMLVSDFTVRYSEFVNTHITTPLTNDNTHNKRTERILFNEYLVTAKELETTPVTEEVLKKAITYKESLIDLFESKVQKIAEEALDIADPMKDTITGVKSQTLRYGPWKEFHAIFWKYFNTLEHFTIPLVSNLPAPIFDGVFRIIVGLSLLIHKRMQLIPVKQRYFQYTAVRAKLLEDFNTVLSQSVTFPIYTLEHFLMCLSKQ